LSNYFKSFLVSIELRQPLIAFQAQILKKLNDSWEKHSISKFSTKRLKAFFPCEAAAHSAS